MTIDDLIPSFEKLAQSDPKMRIDYRRIGDKETIQLAGWRTKRARQLFMEYACAAGAWVTRLVGVELEERWLRAVYELVPNLIECNQPIVNAGTARDSAGSAEPGNQADSAAATVLDAAEASALALRQLKPNVKDLDTWIRDHGTVFLPSYLGPAIPKQRVFIPPSAYEDHAPESVSNPSGTIVPPDAANDMPSSAGTEEEQPAVSSRKIRKEVKAVIESMVSDEALIEAYRTYGSYRKAAKALHDQGIEGQISAIKSRIERAVNNAGGYERVMVSTTRSAVPAPDLSHPRDT